MACAMCSLTEQNFPIGTIMHLFYKTEWFPLIQLAHMVDLFDCFFSLKKKAQRLNRSRIILFIYKQQMMIKDECQQ